MPLRLINVKTLKLESFPDRDRQTPPYAILSHRWGEEEDELSFDEMNAEEHWSAMLELKQRWEYDLSTLGNSAFYQLRTDMTKSQNLAAPMRYRKVVRSCMKAEQQAISYIWIDTCCIDKRSSSELTEAINSMFAWYRDAAVCYAYLNVVERADPMLSTP